MSSNTINDILAPTHVANVYNGELYISSAPGRQTWHLGGNTCRDLNLDLEVLKRFNISTIVSCIEPFEYQEIKIPNYPLVAKRNFNFISHPIKDCSIPADSAAFKRLIRRILTKLHYGHRVLIHCSAGLGRSALTIACCLKTTGASSHRAIRKVQNHRRGSLYLEKQREYVRTFNSK